MGVRSLVLTILLRRKLTVSREHAEIPITGQTAISYDGARENEAAIFLPIADCIVLNIDMYALPSGNGGT